MLTKNTGELLNNSDVIKQTVSILNVNNSIEIGRNSLRRSRVDTKKLKLRIECPVDLNVYDSANNHVWPVSDKEFEEKIKGASYYTLGDTKIAFLNKWEERGMTVVRWCREKICSGYALTHMPLSISTANYSKIAASCYVGFR